MTALAVLTDARDRGVKVTVEGDKIILEGEITPDIVATFKAHKSEILKLLAAVPAATPDESPLVPGADTRPDIISEALGMLCDDCGRPTVIAIVTDYGARYCRECVFPSVSPKMPNGTRLQRPATRSGLVR